MDGRRRFEHREHLVRVALLFLAGIAAFVALRAVLVPPGFGLYGHYRAGSLADNRAHPFRFAGREACADCHDEGEKLDHGTALRKVGCESCHGPLAAHVDDPEKAAAGKLDAGALCLRCHSPNPAKPAAFPQIDPAKHEPEGECIDCHDPHAPKL